MRVSVASVKRSFSKLKLIKNYLRFITGQERLSNLAIISIESEECEIVIFILSARFLIIIIIIIITYSQSKTYEKTNQTQFLLNPFFLSLWTCKQTFPVWY